MDTDQLPDSTTGDDYGDNPEVATASRNVANRGAQPRGRRPGVVTTGWANATEQDLTMDRRVDRQDRRDRADQLRVERSRRQRRDLESDNSDGEETDEVDEDDDDSSGSSSDGSSESSTEKSSDSSGSEDEPQPKKPARGSNTPRGPKKQSPPGKNGSNGKSGSGGSGKAKANAKANGNSNGNTNGTASESSAKTNTIVDAAPPKRGRGRPRNPQNQDRPKARPGVKGTPGRPRNSTKAKAATNNAQPVVSTPLSSDKPSSSKASSRKPSTAETAQPQPQPRAAQDSKRKSSSCSKTPAAPPKEDTATTTESDSSPDKPSASTSTSEPVQNAKQKSSHFVKTIPTDESSSSRVPTVTMVSPTKSLVPLPGSSSAGTSSTATKAVSTSAVKLKGAPATLLIPAEKTGKTVPKIVTSSNSSLQNGCTVSKATMKTNPRPPGPPWPPREAEKPVASSKSDTNRGSSVGEHINPANRLSQKERERNLASNGHSSSTQTSGNDHQPPQAQGQQASAAKLAFSSNGTYPKLSPHVTVPSPQTAEPSKNIPSAKSQSPVDQSTASAASSPSATATAASTPGTSGAAKPTMSLKERYAMMKNKQKERLQQNGTTPEAAPVVEPAKSVSRSSFFGVEMSASYEGHSLTKARAPTAYDLWRGKQEGDIDSEYNAGASTSKAAEKRSADGEEDDASASKKAKHEEEKAKDPPPRPPTELTSIVKIIGYEDEFQYEDDVAAVPWPPKEVRFPNLGRLLDVLDEKYKEDELHYQEATRLCNSIKKRREEMDAMARKYYEEHGKPLSLYWESPDEPARIAAKVRADIFGFQIPQFVLDDDARRKREALETPAERKERLAKEYEDFMLDPFSMSTGVNAAEEAKKLTEKRAEEDSKEEKRRQEIARFREKREQRAAEKARREAEQKQQQQSASSKLAAFHPSTSSRHHSPPPPPPPYPNPNATKNPTRKEEKREEPKSRYTSAYASTFYGSTPYGSTSYSSAAATSNYKQPVSSNSQYYKDPKEYKYSNSAAHNYSSSSNYKYRK
uniref:Uncharacterized protein n=1 Tax=Caenorhabditis japonica TaxID=281687 RepID=A0A8R1I9S8_CAEJA